MTDQERDDMLREIHDALMKPGIDGTPALIVQISEVCKAYQRGKWASRAIIWGLPTIALLGGAIQKILGWNE